MPDMTEQAARASLSPLVARHSPDALARVARGEMVDVPQSTRRSVETVVEGFGEGATVGLIETISEEREAMGALEPQVEEQQTFGAEGGETAARASEQARQTREADRGARRGEGQMDIETAAATRRFGEFGEEGTPTTERGPGPDEPTRIRGREPDQDPDDVYSAEEQGQIIHHTQQWAEAGNTGPLSTLLRVFEVSTRMNMARHFEDAGIETPEDMIAHFERRGDFEDVEAVGPASSRRIEAAIPLLREALEDDEDGAGDSTITTEGVETQAVEFRDRTVRVPAEVNGWNLDMDSGGNEIEWFGATKKDTGTTHERITFRKTDDGYRARWFSPRVHYNVSGHVTVAEATIDEFRDEPGEKVTLDDVRDQALGEAISWMRDHASGEFIHPKYHPDFREKLPGGWEAASYEVSTRKVWMRWRHPETGTVIQAEGIPGGSNWFVTTEAPDWDRGEAPTTDDLGVVIPSNAQVVQIIERMRRMAEAIDTDREQADVAGDEERFKQALENEIPDLTGQATQALLRNFDSWDELLDAPVGEVYGLTGVGQVAIRAIMGEPTDSRERLASSGPSTDPRSTSITVREARARSRREEDEEDDEEGHEFEEDDRVRHRDGRTGTVTGTTDIAVTVEWDEGGDQIVSPASVEAVPEDLEDDNPGNGGNPNGDDDGPGGEETRTILTMGGEPEDESLEFEAPVEVNGWELIEQDTPSTRGFLGWERGGAEVWIGRFSAHSFRVSSYPGNDQIEMAPNIETALTAARSYMATHDPNGDDGSGSNPGRERFKDIEEEHEDDVEQLGLGEGALPDRDREE